MSSIAKDHVNFEGKNTSFNSTIVLHTCQPFCGIFPHLNDVFRIHLKILRNHKFTEYIDSHQMGVKSLRKRLRQETRDEMSRTRDERGLLEEG